jgi:hypothetical protein
MTLLPQHQQRAIEIIDKYIITEDNNTHYTLVAVIYGNNSHFITRYVNKENNILINDGLRTLENQQTTTYYAMSRSLNISTTTEESTGFPRTISGSSYSADTIIYVQTAALSTN